MKNYTDDIDLIERYFEKSLNDDEAAVLSQRLRNEPELKKLLEEESLLVNTIRYQGALESLDYLRKLENSLEKRSTTRWYYLAAACAGLIAIAWFYVGSLKQTPEQLYASYFEPYPNVFESATRGNSNAGTREDAFRAYDEGDYATAATLFNELLRSNEDPAMLLLLGNANLMLGNNDDAIANFKTLLVRSDDLEIQADWYLALAYLKTGETAKARPILSRLSETGTDYATKARALIHKLD